MSLDWKAAPLVAILMRNTAGVAHGRTESPRFIDLQVELSCTAALLARPGASPDVN